MDHAGGVDGLQRLRDPGDQYQDGFRRQRALAGDDGGEGGGGDVSGGQPWPRGVGVTVDDRGGVQALDPLGDRHLRGEAAAERGIGGELRPGDLECDRPAARGVGEVHRSHAALADPGPEQIPADLKGVLRGQRGEYRIPRRLRPGGWCQR